MSWNYRILKTQDADGSPLWGVHEVYYNKAGEVEGWTERSVSIVGDTWKELHDVLGMFRQAWIKPPLDVTSGTAVALTLTGRPRTKRIAR